ncbi:MAG TPA: hypothetical protein VEU96_00305 [Bryobacteraceae bacterium]|nr:hypothetical protein [Bryobacteraceae bacterium]
MNQHLSSEQIARWMTGERTPADEQHARQCRECGAELARMQAALALFRGSVREWSEQSSVEKQPVWKAEPARRRWGIQPVRWALACVVLLLLAAIPVYRNAQEKQRQAALAKADAALLEQVDAEISRAVPSTMEPLVKLVAWDPAPADREGDSGTNQKGGIIQ